MPTFEYQCECGHKFDQIHKEPVYYARCPKCGKMAKRIYSTFAFVMKI